MNLRPFRALLANLGATALVATGLLASPALAQPAPGPAPLPPAPGPAAQPPTGWGTVPPAQSAQPAPTVAPYPAPQQPGAYPPGAYPQGGYPPPGAYPQGGYPPGGYPPGAYPAPDGWGNPNEPTVIGPDGRPHLLPLEIAYDAEKGIPPGYKLVEKKRMNLIVAGLSTFGGLWVASCIAGGIMEENNNNNYYYGQKNEAWPMYLPVIGPLITIGTAHTSSAGTTALLFDTLGQAGGVAMFIAGMAAPQKVLKFQFQGTAQQLKLTPIAAPLQDGAFAGLKGSF